MTQPIVRLTNSSQATQAHEEAPQSAELPMELILKILSFLPWQDKVEARLLSKYVYRDLINKESSLSFNNNWTAYGKTLKHALHFFGGEFGPKYQVTSISLQNTEPTVEEISLLSIKFPLLEELNLDSSNITNEHLENLKLLRNLTYLSLTSNPEITDDGIVHLIELKELTSLDLSMCKQITDRGVCYLKNLNKLKHLSIDSCGEITMDSVSQLTQLSSLSAHSTFTDDTELEGLLRLQQLEFLNFGDNSINDPACEMMASLGQLQALELDATYIRDQDVSTLLRARKFSSLNLQGAHITNASMALLANQVELENLNLAGIPYITEQSLRHLAQLTKLSTLKLDGLKLSEIGGAHLGTLGALTTLQLCYCDVDDKDLFFLSSLTGLRSLNLNNNIWITDETLKNIQHLPRLESLTLSSCLEITDTGIAYLQSHQHLQILDISSCEKITDIGYEMIARLSKLRTLIMNFCSKISGQRLKDITERLPALQSLGLANIGIEDQDIEHLTKLKYLKELTLAHLPISDQAFANICTIPTLQILDLFNCDRITSAGWAFLPQLTNLREIDLESTSFTPSDAQVLVTLKKLNKLTVDRNHFDPYQLRVIQNLLPHTFIE